jgi:hypothetical protein
LLTCRGKVCVYYTVTIEYFSALFKPFKSVGLIAGVVPVKKALVVEDSSGRPAHQKELALDHCPDNGSA